MKYTPGEEVKEEEVIQRNTKEDQTYTAIKGLARLPVELTNANSFCMFEAKDKEVKEIGEKKEEKEVNMEKKEEFRQCRGLEVYEEEEESRIQKEKNRKEKKEEK